MRLSVRLFGAPRFSFDGVPWRIAAAPRRMQLLAYLALSGEPAARSAVAAAIWPDDVDRAARSNLRRHIYQLRRGLPQIDGVEWIDDPATRRTALALDDGDLLTGFDDEWLVIARERLRSRFHEALLDEAVASRRARDFSAAILYAERLSAADDLREGAVREIIAAQCVHERFGYRHLLRARVT